MFSSGLIRTAVDFEELKKQHALVSTAFQELNQQHEVIKKTVRTQVRFRIFRLLCSPLKFTCPGSD